MELAARIGARFPRLFCERDFSFARHTSIGCGGCAALAVSPSSAEEAAQLLFYLRREGIAYFLLGAGANVLPSDAPYDGVVVRFARLKGIAHSGDTVIAGAGVTGGALLSYATRQGIGGFSPFSGIPMTVGGGTAMNAGVRELHFSDVVTRVVCAERGRLRTLRTAECGFSEKESLFLSGIAVLGVHLRGRPALPDDIARESCYFRTRRAVLPKGRSMGCTFVNPEGVTAGALIERCNLKGVRRGGAVVSTVHANFIMNEGATCADIAALIAFVREEVVRRTGIVLREEIRRIPPP